MKNYIKSNLDSTKDQNEVTYNIGGGEITGKANIISDAAAS